jgi:hypothetical protein
MTHRNDYVPKEFGTAPLGAIRNGRLGEPKVFTRGGQPFKYEIEFSNRLSVGDTIMVNGVVWTMIANGATPSGNEIALGAATVADDANAVRNALMIPLGQAGYIVQNANPSGSTWQLKFERNDNIPFDASQHLVSIANGATVTLTQQGYIEPMIEGDTCNFILTPDDSLAVQQVFFLPDGMEFEQRVISMSKLGRPCEIRSMNDNIDGGTSLLLSNRTHFAVLQFLGGVWRVIASAPTVLQSGGGEEA